MDDKGFDESGGLLLFWLRWEFLASGHHAEVQGDPSGRQDNPLSLVSTLGNTDEPGGQLTETTKTDPGNISLQDFGAGQVDQATLRKLLPAQFHGQSRDQLSCGHRDNLGSLLAVAVAGCRDGSHAEQ